ncbi:hypothetical protein DS2_12864 [Catenovulum agarivorans DS-2]|uniref:DUF952 domain-containing protein n=1 Tax=Catenovulum agarivorans DS-2 TaxID=1328313 RepID=W7QVW3_9ALTE|nr:DUF952 domain-containing protein [Catenovulum agarivorans]EWH09425.1 hypothetical protein DS2_12864 [Catenovulum agarivorans DS-2]
MGFKIEVNSILRSDEQYDLKVGEIYSFSKQGSRVFFDDIPVWLTDSNWLALAEISIVSQTRENNQLCGQFRVDYIYQGEEQQNITNMFIRMYGGLMDPYIYLLSSEAEYKQALASGQFVRDSLQTEGFIHASPKSQLSRVANKFYKKTEQPIIIELDKKLITSEVKWEPATGGLYPHIFGPINIDSVYKVIPIAPESSGDFSIDITAL